MYLSYVLPFEQALALTTLLCMLQSLRAIPLDASGDTCLHAFAHPSTYPVWDFFVVA